MNNTTKAAFWLRLWPLFAFFGLLLNTSLAQAQSGPYGNEWIVPGQQYYKIKIVKDGLYKINYQYLTQAGISGVVPNELQIWRRGQQIATYVGGNPTTLDATSYLEFYAVHNDARMDAELYKRPTDQPHQYFSFYTDTAAYFITWHSGTAGRHMQEPIAGAGTLQAHRLLNNLFLRVGVFSDYPTQTDDVYLPWVEPAEGFFMNVTQTELTYGIDSVSVSSVTASTLPRLEVSLFGAQNRSQGYGGGGTAHSVQVVVKPPTGPERVLGVMNFTGLVRARQYFDLQPADISATGRVTVQLRSLAAAGTGNFFYSNYLRITNPQANVWYPARHQLTFASDSLLGGPAAYELPGLPPAVVGFDIQDLNNVQRVVGVPGTAAGTTRFVFPGATALASHRLLLADESFLPVPPLPARLVRFRNIDPAQPTFVVITHPLLMQPATGTTNAALAYTSYRASVAGGKYDTLMMTTFQLYDQFLYGDKSWLALRHFSRWLAAANPVGGDRFLLLLGKGIVPSEPVRGAFFARNGEFGLDLVPTSSRSVSDNLLTADYANGDYVAKLHTGRLTATNPQQVMNYLNKIKTHDALGPAPWRKNVLHLVGAKNINNEEQEFTGYLDREKARIERPFLGGSVTTLTVATPLPVPVDISAQLNAGVSLIDYFGHGSNNFFQLDFSAPSKAPTYNNPGKYPVLFLSGCAGNATCVSTYTVVEDYLFADQKGAIGSLGESGFGFPYPLSVALDSLHKLLFNDARWYGRPITVVHDEMVRRLQDTQNFSDDIGMEQLLSTNWQGDPTIALYSPVLPDLVASAATLSITPSVGQSQVKATSADFVLNVGVANPGKITADSIQLKVIQRRSGKADVVARFTRPQSALPATSYALTIRNAFVGQGGTTTFLVTLDPDNLIAESNENNNSAQIDFSFLTGGLAVLNPTEFAISATATPRLAVQSNNPNEASRVYEFELDTDPGFASGPALKKTTTVTAGVLAEWLPTLPTTVASRDSVVWFWRARFQTPAAGEDGNWVTSSFRVIPDSPAGWSQSHAGQFKRDALTGIDVSGPPTTWAFSAVRVPLVLQTAGGGPPRSAPQFGNLLGGGIYLQSAGLPVVRDCGVKSPNLLIAVYDGGSLRPIILPTTYQRCGLAPNFAYFFSTSAPRNAADTLDNLNYSATRQQQLDAFLTAIPNNAYVAVISTNRLRYSLLPAALKTRLQTLLGSQLITTLADGEPLALVGQKLTATTGRLLHEQGPDRTSTTLAYNQRIELTDTLLRPGTAGHIVSTQIGPSQQWNNLYASILKPNNSGQYTLNVVGIDVTGVETTVLPNVTIPGTGALTTQPLGGISAATYPYLRLDLTLADTAHVAPQLRQWLVTSRGLPEGIVQRDAVPASTYAAATLLAQATSPITKGVVSFPVKFKNISTETFNGPLNTRVQVRDLSNNSIKLTAPLISTPAPLPGETATINASINMAGLFGRFSIEVVVNPRLQNPSLQPEQNYANNELILPEFSIIDNNVPPTLDVAVDGRHILNGELVSSRPVILIQLNDEDQLRHITDASVFTLTLQRPGQTGLGSLVPLTGSDVHFTVDTSKGSAARLTYEPGLNGPLPDGKYTLRVQGRDPSNAAAAAQDVQLSFEVVNAATISNVYPFPNPVISKARFVFTVTGQELPRNMKIQIMSLTGRVVREIFMSELGPLHIGNNITDYAWDGTDSYGDRLANGTYLYRVAYDDSNVSFSHRETAGDKAFKNDWGKLVLMR